MTTLSIAQLESLFNDSSKSHCLEGFCFTLQHGLNFYFDDYEEFTGLLSKHDLEVEFWLLDDKYEVEDFKALEELLDFISVNDEGDIENAVAVKVEGIADTLEAALEWHNDNLFCENMTNEDLGYYIIDEGLFGVEIPDSLISYIDHEKLGRDWKYGLVEIGNYLYLNH